MNSNELVRTKLEQGLSLGSLKSLVKATAESVMLLLDTSGSMETRMSTGRRRIDGLRVVVTDIKAQGHVPMIAFGGPYDSQVRFVDVVPDPDGGTPLHEAIPFAKVYGATRLVVISDGCPDLTDQSMEAARAFGGQIDVVFVGNAGESGSFFLDQLAQATGGKRFEGSLGDTKQLTATVIGLLEGEVEPTRAPIQGPGFTADEADPLAEADDPDDDTEDEDEEADDEDDDK